MQPLFDIQEVTKRYKDVTALGSISFSIQQGEILGYIGPNGAGKTTTIKLLVGLIKNYEGIIRYKDQPLSNQEVSSELHRELGYLPQEVEFQNWRTVHHALSTFGLLSGIPKSVLNDAIERSLEIVGLNDVQNKKIVHLSGGMKQKLKFAQALMHDPPFLVLDEPMSGLDPGARYQVSNIIKKLHKKGTTIFFSSHILGDIENLATRIAIIHQGRIMKTGTPAELREEFRISNSIKIAYSKQSSQLQQDKIDSIQEISQESELEQIIHMRPEIGIDQGMQKILNYITENSIKIRKIDVLEPDLEDVYLHFVGGGK